MLCLAGRGCGEFACPLGPIVNLTVRPPKRSLHLVFESHDGRALVPIPKRSTSPWATSTLSGVDSLKALDLKRPIREADIRCLGSPCPLCAISRPEQVQQHSLQKPCYSITSSARPSSGSGKVMPSALAVLRLMASSTFTAW